MEKGTKVNVKSINQNGVVMSRNDNRVSVMMEDGTAKVFDISDIEMFGKGGKVGDCIEYIKNSQQIKNNGYYLHIENMNNYVASNSVNTPKINSLCLITFNSGGQDNLKAVDTINSMSLASEIAKLLDIDIEIARIIVSEQITHSKPFTMSMLNDIENKNIIIADRDKIVCTNLSMKYAKGGEVESEFKVEVNQYIPYGSSMGKNYYYVTNSKGNTISKKTKKVYRGKQMNEYKFDTEKDAQKFANSMNKKYAKGGVTEDTENAQMVLNNNKQIAHHTKELPNAIKGKKVPAWVVAKVNRSASDLSDATHYMDGQGESYAKGGSVELKWTNLSIGQRYEFLDSFGNEITPSSKEEYTKKAFRFLPKKIKEKFLQSKYADKYGLGGFLFGAAVGAGATYYILKNKKQSSSKSDKTKVAKNETKNIEEPKYKTLTAKEKDGVRLLVAITKDGFDYAIRFYSDYKNINDKKFVSLRKDYIANVSKLEKYIESKNPIFEKYDLSTKSVLDDEGIEYGFLDGSKSDWKGVKDAKFQALLKSAKLSYNTFQKYIKTKYKLKSFNDDDIMGRVAEIEIEKPEKMANGGGVSSRYNQWAKNIYENQSEEEARVGLMQFAREEGFDYSDVEKALQTYKYDTEENAWGELYYTKKAIRNMISIISNETFANGGGVAYETKYDLKGWRKSQKSWVVINKNPMSYEKAQEMLENARKSGLYDTLQIESNMLKKPNYATFSVNKRGGQYANGGGVDDLLEFTIPTWAMTSLINGDDSGLEDEDIEKANDFVDRVVKKYGNANFMLGDKSEETEFYYRNDIDGNMGGDVTTLYLRPTKKYAKGGGFTKYVRAYYNESISNEENGYQVNLMFYNNQGDDDYFDEEFITTNSPEEAEKLAHKINKEGYEKFMPKGNKYSKGGKLDFVLEYDEHCVNKILQMVSKVKRIVDYYVLTDRLVIVLRNELYTDDIDILNTRLKAMRDCLNVFEDEFEIGNKEGYKTLLLRFKNTNYENGGMVDGEYVDLFEHYEHIPENIQAILDRYSEEFGGDGSDMDYQDTANMLKEVEAEGYTFDYYLDNEPYGLRPIGVKLNQLKDFEDFDEEDYAKGGGIGEELMGGQPNKSEKSGYKLLKVQHDGKVIIVTDNNGETKERWIKNDNGFAGYTLRYNGNEYEFADSFNYAKGGRLTSNEDIIEAFLTSNREAKVGNLSTHYNEYDNQMLLRNYGTLIASRKGNNVHITSIKYSVTTTKITNMVNRMAKDKGLNVKYVEKFEDGGMTSSYCYEIGGL